MYFVLEGSKLQFDVITASTAAPLLNLLHLKSHSFVCFSSLVFSVRWQQAEDGNQHEWYKKMYNTIHKVHEGGECIYEYFRFCFIFYYDYYYYNILHSLAFATHGGWESRPSFNFDARRNKRGEINGNFPSFNLNFKNIKSVWLCFYSTWKHTKCTSQVFSFFIRESRATFSARASCDGCLQVKLCEHCKHDGASLIVLSTRLFSTFFLLLSSWI